MGILIINILAVVVGVVGGIIIYLQHGYQRKHKNNYMKTEEDKKNDLN